jgi:purine-binding chemotaxis protein CheW
MPAPPGAAPTIAASWLVCRSGAFLAALPVEHIVETMRLLPLAGIAGAPAYVLGVSIIRGAPVPVVDTGLLVNGAPSRPGRLVTVRTETIVALAVDEVVGIAAFAADALGALPPLLQAAAAETIAGVGAADSGLLVFLHASRLVPDDVLARLDTGGAPS